MGAGGGAEMPGQPSEASRYDRARMTTGSFRRVIGIVGGLGPMRISNSSGGCSPPSRTRARIRSIRVGPLLDSADPRPHRGAAWRGPSPVPWLLRSLDRLAGCCDFAVITCVTAHAFLDEIRPQARLPLLDLVEISAREAAPCCGEGARIGLLATVGTLRSRVFDRALAGVARRSGSSLLSICRTATGCRKSW